LKALKTPSLLLFVVLLAACATMTFDQRLQYGYQLNTSVRDAATLSLNSERITSRQAEEVLKITDSARELLDTAANGDERGLDLALEVLQALDKETP
jgi:hypothetical protein